MLNDNNLGWPIALRIVPCFQEFTIELATTQIFNNINETVKDPKWKASVEEIRAFEKNETWKLTNLLKGKKQSVANGFSPSNIR